MIRLISFLFLCSPLLAQAAVVVEKIQMPAWLLQNQTKIALTPGIVLTKGDQIITGNSARVYLKLEEGSRIKIGANAQFKVSSLAPEQLAEPQLTDTTDTFTAVFNVIKGAFRFTTNELFKSRRRNININIGTVTAGIRGTDLWGRSNNENDLVCLIEGNIAVTKQGSPQTTLNEPRAYVTAHPSATLSPIQFVSNSKLDQWAKSTEIADNVGYISSIGKYTVQLLSVKQQSTANNIANKMKKSGYASKVIAITIDGVNWYRVSITGFDSLQGARAFSDKIKGQFSAGKPWIF